MSVALQYAALVAMPLILVFFAISMYRGRWSTWMLNHGGGPSGQPLWTCGNCGRRYHTYVAAERCCGLRPDDIDQAAFENWRRGQ